MEVVNPLVFETTGVWLSRQKYEEAESVYQQYLAGGRRSPAASPNVKGQYTKQQLKSGTGSALVNQMECMRTKISDVLSTGSLPMKKVTGSDAITDRIQCLEKENKDLRTVVQSLERRIMALEGGSKVVQKSVAPVKPVVVEDDDDDDIDLFGDVDSEEEENAKKLHEQRIKEYEERKKKKPSVIAKSNLILDVKPWDDETCMKMLEDCVRSVEMDGLLWGASKLVPVGYGINKLQISCVIEDDKVCTDDIEERLTSFEDYIQSMDIAAFNKV